MLSYLRFAFLLSLVGSLGNCVSQAPLSEREPASVEQIRGWKLQRNLSVGPNDSEWQIVPIDHPAPSALSLD